MFSKQAVRFYLSDIARQTLEDGSKEFYLIFEYIISTRGTAGERAKKIINPFCEAKSPKQGAAGASLSSDARQLCDGTGRRARLRIPLAEYCHSAKIEQCLVNKLFDFI